MADTTATVTVLRKATAKTIPISPITAAPSLTHRHDLRKRQETVGYDTCGWVNGDLNTPLVCDYPYVEPCLWSPELHAVGCCGGSETTDCAWYTSCVPYSMVNNGCDSACQANYMNTVCDEAYSLCATATFGGPEGYTYLSCTDTLGPTDTMMVTYYGGNGSNIIGLPRYFSDYWFSSTATATDSSSTSSPTSDSGSDDLGDTVSWFSAHRGILIGAIAGFVGLIFVLFVLCCFYRRRKTRAAYTPAHQQHGNVYTLSSPGMQAQPYAQSQEGYPMMQYGGGYGQPQTEYGHDYGRVYVQPSK